MKVKDLKKLLNKYDDELEIYVLEQTVCSGDGDIMPLHKKLIIKEDNINDYVLHKKENKYLNFHFDLHKNPGLIINHKKHSYQEIQKEIDLRNEEDLKNIECYDILI